MMSGSFGNTDRLNLLKMAVQSDNALGIPFVLPVQNSVVAGFDSSVVVVPWRSLRFERITKNFAAHCFVDDYRFETSWTSPIRALKYALRFAFVFSPDFTLSPDYPLVLNHFQVYRARWVARFWQNNGVLVVPSISWAGVDSFDYAFLGVPQNSVVSIATYGIGKNLAGFMAGYRAMCDVLNPSAVYVCGELPEQLHSLAAHYPIPPFYETIRRRAQRFKRAETLSLPF